VTLAQAALLGLAAALAGAINAVAGGGTLLTFPALLGVGLPSISANATNTAGLSPAAFVGAWSFRDRLDPSGKKLLLPLGVLGALGALVGGGLLLLTPITLFNKLIPFLILAATLLFAFPPKVSPGFSPSPLKRSQARFRPSSPSERGINYRGLGPFILLFFVAVYGGYFGAGIGILSLAALSMLGFSDVSKANAIKAIFTGGVNAVAALLFAVRGLVFWKEALLVSAFGMLGAWGGAGVAKKIGNRNVKRLVIVIGVGLSLQTLWKFWINP
jgi:uncharacterized protein